MVIRMSDLRDQGLNVFREMLPGVLPEAVPNEKVSFGGGFASELMEIGIEGIFGRLWTRDGLSRRDRSLVTLGILIALGAELEMESHFRIAAQNGLTEAELAEVIYRIRLRRFSGRQHGQTRRPQGVEQGSRSVRTRPGTWEPPGGIEPPTYSLRVNRSTD